MTIQPPIAGETIATIRSYPELVEAFRLIKARLGLSNKWCDDSTDRPDGFTDKVLGPSQNKNISPLTFSMFCQIFAVQFEMKIDVAMLARMERHWEERSEPQVVVPDGRISKKLIEKAKPYARSDFAREAGKVSGSKRAGSLATKLMQKLGKKRMKKATKAQRRLMAKKGWQTRRANQIAAQELAARLLLEQHPGSIAPECPSSSAASIGEIRLPA